jgi:hypothetical protein
VGMLNELRRSNGWQRLCLSRSSRFASLGFLRAAGVSTALSMLLALSQGCSRSGASQQTGVTPSSVVVQQQLPFHDGIENNVDDAARPVVAARSGPASLLKSAKAPAYSHILPAGTLITIRLHETLVLSRIHAGDTFNATLAEALIADGSTLIESGTPLTGEIEFAQLPVVEPNRTTAPGYLRLTLSTISFGGGLSPLHTSSLFARASLPAAMPISTGTRLRSFRLEKGHLLTFRLSLPVTITQAESLAKRD